MKIMAEICSWDECIDMLIAAKGDPGEVSDKLLDRAMHWRTALARMDFTPEKLVTTMVKRCLDMILTAAQLYNIEKN